MAASVKHFSDDGATQITAYTWPDAVSGQNQMPRKFAFQNVGDRVLANMQASIGAVGLNDGSQQLRLALDSATLSHPFGVTATLNGTGSGGVWNTTGTKGFKITALNAIGETVASEEVTLTVDDITKSVLLNWTAVTGATGYKVYDTDTAGDYTSPSLRVTLAAVTTYTDNGGARSAGSPPTDNRTAGWLTTLALSAPAAGGVWSGTGFQFYRVTALDSSGVTIAASLEASVNVDDVTKKVSVSWVGVTGASTYNVYRSTTTGTYTSPALRTNTASTSFVDDGSATGVGSLTIAASYGIPPSSGSFSTNPLAFGNVAINQQIFYWANRVVPAATPEAGNPRLALVSLREI